MLPQGIDINDYDYILPDDRIAQYPAEERDKSQLLVFRHNEISKDFFHNIYKYIPSDSLLVFNNTKVIRARLLFKKDSGAQIEILCLEPLSPPDYGLSFASKKPVEWKCIVGNLKKWKTGILSAVFRNGGLKEILYAEKIKAEGEAWRIRFSWDNADLSFSDVIEGCGHMPLPPYISRADEINDSTRYQTVYSKIKGSVAAPTAGLHFTDEVFKRLSEEGIRTAEITLHVGAGTFQPVKSENIYEHEMHTEHFSADKKNLESLLQKQGRIIAVGTTSVRTLESLYWLGVKLIMNSEAMALSAEFTISQWEAYDLPSEATLEESITALINYMNRNKAEIIKASTSILIIPGYEFKVVSGMITNFHQPKSTLLLLISAFIGIRWKELYIFALENNFRFLSYGDSSLLLRSG